MARDKSPDLFNQIIDDARKKPTDDTKRTQSEPNTSSTHSEPLENTQRTHWEHRQKTDLDTFSIRLNVDDKRRLAEYFEKRGLALSQGLRMWILERMDSEGL